MRTYRDFRTDAPLAADETQKLPMYQIEVKNKGVWQTLEVKSHSKSDLRDIARGLGFTEMRYKLL